MNILLLGYGKMGKAIEAIAVERGHHIIAHPDNREERDSFKDIDKVDVAIEFSQPEAAIDNLRYCFNNSIPVVCGTTGWQDHRAEVEKECQEKQGTLFYTSNFSLGVNLFFRLNEHLARLMNNYTQYDVSIDETHHTQKKDAPSGTAITLAEGVIRNLDRKKNWALSKKQDDTVTINSFRIDPDPGTHVIKYHSTVDDIEIMHKAHSRQGFALGAVVVAEWASDKKGVLNMKDFLGF